MANAKEIWQIVHKCLVEKLLKKYVITCIALGVNIANRQAKRSSICSNYIIGKRIVVMCIVTNC